MTNSNEEEPEKADLSIGRDVKNSNILIGNNNQVTIHRTALQWRAVAVILLGVVIASLFVVYMVKFKTPEVVMVGEFRIAIAGFAEHGQGLPDKIGYTVAESMYQRLFDDLVPIIPDALQVELWDTDKTGIIDGATAEIRAEQAAQLARKIQADLIIYGIVEGDAKGVTITPEFYLDPNSYYDGAEITGQYGLSKIVLPVATSSKWRGEFNDKMKVETSVISAFAKGLNFYSNQKYDKALEIFQKIDKTDDWNDPDGKKALYALTGFAAVKTGDFDLGEQMLKNSKEIDKEYARPYIGLANLAYMRALQPMEESRKPIDLDFNQLLECDRYLEIARNAAHKPPLSEVPTKIHFAQGQCDLMKTASGHAVSYETAIIEFRKVIEAYGNGANTHVQEYAGESYARLGLIDDWNNNPLSAAENYQKAAEILKIISPESAEYYRNRAAALRNLTATP